MEWLKTTKSGERFDTSGPLRVVPRGNDHYVVGRGVIFHVNSIHEGHQIIRDLRDGNTTCDEVLGESNDSNSNRDVHNVVRSLWLDRIRGR